MLCHAEDTEANPKVRKNMNLMVSAAYVVILSPHDFYRDSTIATVVLYWIDSTRWASI
jgi:hypothetical protein